MEEGELTGDERSEESGNRRETKRVGETVRWCGREIFIWQTEQRDIQLVHVFLGLPAEQTARRANTAP